MSVHRKKSQPSHDPAHGVTFGRVVVTVSHEMQDCVLHVDLNAQAVPARQVRLESPEEVEGALAAQEMMAAVDPVAGNMVSALRFADEKLTGTR